MESVNPRPRMLARLPLYYFLFFNTGNFACNRYPLFTFTTPFCLSGLFAFLNEYLFVLLRYQPYYPSVFLKVVSLKIMFVAELGYCQL